MEGSDIKYNGDPLQDFTTMRFLDRFVFRNPKKTDLKAGSSVFNKRNQYRAKGIKSLAPDSKEYLSKDLEQIPIGNVQFSFTIESTNFNFGKKKSLKNW